MESHGRQQGAILFKYEYMDGGGCTDAHKGLTLLYVLFCVLRTPLYSRVSPLWASVRLITK